MQLHTHTHRHTHTHTHTHTQSEKYKLNCHVTRSSSHGIYHFLGQLHILSHPHWEWQSHWRPNTHTHTALKVQHATATFQIHTQNKYRAECVARKSDLLSNEAAVSFSASSRSGNTGLYPTTTEALERDEPGLAGWHSDFRSYTIIECFQQYCFHFAPSKIDYVFR